MAVTTSLPNATPRDHGGGMDAAMAHYGGARSDWVDLSTGINPQPYPLPAFTSHDWAALPDHAAQQALTDAARAFWNVPDGAKILPAPGASALIARIPALAAPTQVQITMPTYNEHAAAFVAQGWQVVDGPAPARVIVHPNNPDGRLWSDQDVTAPLTVIDESFADICPDHSLIHLATRPGVIVLKSFGKFWGLAGLRLGFAIARPDTIARLNDLTGPWAVSGPALRVGAMALRDHAWAAETRSRLAQDATRLDHLMIAAGAELTGGTDLFRLYQVDDAARWQDHLARHHILSRIFPYSDRFLRLGLPPADAWPRIERALDTLG